MKEAVRVAMVGTAHSHAPGKMQTLRDSPRFEVVGAAEEDPAVRAVRCVQKEFAGVRWANAEELLGDPSIEAIAVEGRVCHNLAVAHAAICAGKHVHLEKPPGTDLQALRALLAEAKWRSLQVQMGYMLRWNRAFQLAFRAAREGWLGDLFLVSGDMSTTPPAPETRVELERYPGGLMFELGCHLIDAMVALLGAPEQVHCVLAHDGPQPGGLPDNTIALFRFAKANATIVSSALEPQAFPRRRFEVVGTDGALVIQPLEPPVVRLYLRRAAGGFAAGWQEVPVEHVPRYRDQLEEWAGTIRGECAPSFGPDHDLRVHETLLRACDVMGRDEGVFSRKEATS